MENKLTKLTAAFFDSIDLKYDIAGESSEVIETGMGGMDNIPGVRLIWIFDDNEHSAHLIAPQIVKVPANKQEQMYKVLNEVNQKYQGEEIF